jgi:hypothetical protein
MPFTVTDSYGQNHTVHSDGQVDDVASPWPVLSQVNLTDDSNQRPEDDPQLAALLFIIERLAQVERQLATMDAALDDSLLRVHQKLDWMHQSMTWLLQMLSGVQQAASMMGGPVGAMVRKMTGGKQS